MRYDPWEVARKKLILVANSKTVLNGKSPGNPGKKSWLVVHWGNYPGEIEKASKNGD
jgi:hypothetical protein